MLFEEKNPILIDHNKFFNYPKVDYLASKKT